MTLSGRLSRLVKLSAYTLAMVKTLNRKSFEEVRADERARLRELEAIGREFARPDSWVQQQWNAGADAGALRETLAARESEQRARDIHPHPRGALAGDAATAAVLAWFGRRPLAEAFAAAHSVELDAEARADSRSALARTAGLQPRNVAIDGLLQDAIVGIDRLQGDFDTARSTFAAAGSSAGAGALPASELARAVRDAALYEVAHEWGARGELWRAVCRVVPAGFIRRTVRVFLSASGGIELLDVSEGGGAPEQVPATVGDWPRADVFVDRLSRKASLSRERLYNAGGSEIDSIIAGAIAKWNDSHDAAVGTALEAATVATESGAFDASHVAAACAALDAQSIGGTTVCRGRRPLLVLGRNRRALLATAPRAEGDRGALVERAIVSPQVDADLAAVVAVEDWRPFVVATLDGRDPMPMPVFGPMVGREGMPKGTPIDAALAFAVALDVSAPAPVLDADGAAVLGAVRLTA